jgi:signal transduction histidine kinase
MLVVAGLIEMALGILAMAVPETFAAPTGGVALALLPRYSAAFIAGGVVTLLSYSIKTRWSGPAGTVLGVLGACALLGVSVFTLFRGSLWAGPVIGIIVGVGVIADAVAPDRLDRGTRREMPSVLAATTCLALLGHATLSLAVPAALRLPASAWLGTVRVPLAWAAIGAVPLLIVGWLVPRLRGATQVTAALPFLVLAAGLAAIGRLPGVVLYGLLAVFLAAEPVLSRVAARRVAERKGEAKVVADYEVATEAAAWGFVLMIALAAAVEAITRAAQALAVLALVCSIFTMYWFHFRSVRGVGLGRTVAGIAIYSFLVSVLVTLTGGVGSPYFFVYSLPIIALAWTRAPETILVPLVIPLAALITETIAMIGSGGSVAAVVLSTAIPRAGGLLLVSGFAYLLARRNLDEQNRTRATSLQMQAVLANMGEGLVTVDAGGRITLCNDAAYALLGVEGVVVGRPLSDLLTFRRLDGSPINWPDHPVRRALSGQRAVWERVLAERSQGTVPVAVSATPLADGQGALGAVVLLRDVRPELEIERMRDDFFFIASHELRTPLTIMKGNLELALEGASDGPVRRTVGEALSSVARLTRMVNDFLDAARLEHGTLSMQIEDGFLPDLVRQAIHTIQPDAERKGLEIAYRERPDLPPVRMDIERALQILLNLLGNSVRYTAQGRVEVWHEVDGRVVETLVRDTGPGIAPEHHDRLFTRFGQVDRGLTRTSGGSGLGLYISRRLAEQMGGTVVLKQSAPGAGSTFAVRLPVAGAPVAS